MTQNEEQNIKSRPMAGPQEGIPLPDLDRLPDYERGFWEASRNRELRIQQCSECKMFRHMPTPMCPTRWNTNGARLAGGGLLLRRRSKSSPCRHS